MISDIQFKEQNFEKNIIYIIIEIKNVSTSPQQAAHKEVGKHVLEHHKI